MDNVGDYNKALDWASEISLNYKLPILIYHFYFIYCRMYHQVFIGHQSSATSYFQHEWNKGECHFLPASRKRFHKHHGKLDRHQRDADVEHSTTTHDLQWQCGYDLQRKRSRSPFWPYDGYEIWWLQQHVQPIKWDKIRSMRYWRLDRIVWKPGREHNTAKLHKPELDDSN